MDSNKDSLTEGAESKRQRVTFRFSDTEIDPDSSWVDYERCSPKAVEALEQNQRMRRHFSVIEVADEDSSESKRPRANTFFGRAKHHGHIKSFELKVIESEAELKSKSSTRSHGVNSENGIWGTHSWSVDSKNLHPEVAELLEAAFVGHTDKIKYILEENSSPDANLNFNAVDLLGRTALHLAVYNNHFETANLLINQGVKIDLWDREKKATPLICAAAIGQLPLVELLLNNGANVNDGYDRGNTALLWATKSGNFECLEKVLEAGALQNTPVMYCETPLHVAASNGDHHSLKLLLEKGADVMLRTGDGRNTALHLAAQECNTSCVKLLLDYNANIDSQNAKGETALHISALKDLDTVQLLLEHGANVRLKDEKGCTPLFYAVEKTSRNSNAPQCVAALIKHNADVNCQDNLGLCPLHIAAIKEAKECASILIENNANVGLQSKSGTSALSLMLRKIPDTMQFVKKHLNKSIIVMRDTNDSSCKVKLDFKTIAPTGCFLPIHSTNVIKKVKDEELNPMCRKESELIKAFLTTGQKDILLHPLVEAFLTLKWKKVRKFFYVGFLLKVILVLLFSFFMVYLYAICVEVKEKENKPKNKTHSTATTSANDTLTIVFGENGTVTAVQIEKPKSPEYKAIGYCFEQHTWITIWSAIVCLASILIVQELTQMFQSFKTYIGYIESWIFWAFITSLCVICTFLPSNGTHFKQQDWQQAFAAISVFLAWIFIVLQLGKFPSSGTLVQMYFKVLNNFVRFFGAYFCFLMAFALAFYILNPVDKAFQNAFFAFTKTIRMMAGDLTPEILFETKFVRIGHILHVIFVIMIVIVLMNLLVGLAVADIQKMYLDARLLRLSRQAALIYHLESSLLAPFLLSCIPKTFVKAIKKNILVLPYLRNGCYHFKPYDHRDDRLPDYLQLATLKIANASSGADQKDLNSDGQFTETECSATLKTLLHKMNEMQNQLDNIIKNLDSMSVKTN